MSAFDFKVIVDNFSFLMNGLLTTLQLAIIAISGGLVLGILVGWPAQQPALRLLPGHGLREFLRSLP
jgi:ABC-type amino acid transport system permease subunit